MSIENGKRIKNPSILDSKTRRRDLRTIDKLFEFLTLNRPKLDLHLKTTQNLHEKLSQEINLPMISVNPSKPRNEDFFRTKMISLHKKITENASANKKLENSLKVNVRIAKSEPKISYVVYKFPIEQRSEKESTLRLMAFQSQKKTRSRALEEQFESPHENCEFINIFKKQFTSRCKHTLNTLTSWKNFTLF